MSATERAHALTSVLKQNDAVLIVALTELSDDLARRQLRNGGPSIAWNIGHLLHHRNQIAAAIGCDGPALDLQPYSTSATDGNDYPAVEEFRAAWIEFSDRLRAAVCELSENRLGTPSPMRLPHGERTLLDALRFVVWHEGLHLGQISMLRSHHGLTPVVSLISAQPAVA